MSNGLKIIAIRKLKKLDTKKKLCKNCLKNKRFNSLRICFRCFTLKQREKKLLQLQKKKERKLKTKKYQKSELKKWHAKAWSVFSEYIRRRAADWRGNVTCITCGKQFHWKELHAGHFKHGKLDFDPMNINPQCPADNTYNGGKLDIYALKLIEMYGLDKVKELEARAEQEEKMSVDKLKEIYLLYSNLIKTL